jgi:hypothetical protein
LENQKVDGKERAKYIYIDRVLRWRIDSNDSE